MNQLNVQELLDKFKSKPNDIVGVDIGSTSIKVVRMKRVSAEELTITAVDVLPPAVIQITEPAPAPATPEPAAKSESKKEQPGTEVALPTFNVTPLDFPPKVRGKYAAFTVTGNSAVIKLINFPGSFDATAEEKVITSLGLDDPN